MFSVDLPRFVAACITLHLAVSPTPSFAQAKAGNDQLEVRRSRVTGLASFVRAKDGGAIPVDAGGAVAAAAGPMAFLRAHGTLFGVIDPASELVSNGVANDDVGYTHTSFRQVYQGVSVFGGVLRVHQDAAGDIRSANGDFYPIPKSLNAVPAITAQVATTAALHRLPQGVPAVEHSELVVVDPGWYGDPPAGVHLAYYLILSDLRAGVREAFFVDAHTARVLDQWNLLETARDRVVTNDSTGFVVRVEGGPATGDVEADGAYDWTGDMYDYLFRAFGRDSIDGAGTTLFATVHLVSTSCPNAFGGTGGTFFCDGIVTDDIVAHEFGHGLTGFTANLIYQNQSGQLNESFSDVLGEVVDLLNGDAAFPGAPGGTPWPPTASGPGTDTPNTARTTCVEFTFMTVNSPAEIAGDYAAQASFGPPLTPAGTSGDVVVADPVRGCIVDLPFTNAGAMPGKVVLIDRGTCTFAEKVKNAQNAGAAAVIVANNVPGGPAPMGGGDPTITIPSVGITQADGTTVKTAALTNTVNVTLRGDATSDVRWLVGEDSTGFGGAIRDMWMPSCMGDPDTANHPFQTCSAADNGGVHSGSGVPNHAFAILTDGKTFNSITVNGIGLFKAAAVWHRALTSYLTPTSDFEDAYAALNQAAADLIGEDIRDPRDGSIFAVFTAADAVEVDNVLRAVEMNTRGLCGANETVLDPNTPPPCVGASIIYSDDFESGVNGWTVSNTGPSGPPTPYNWVQQNGGLPLGQPGTVWLGEDRNIGDCAAVDESAVHTLFSPVIALPASLTQPTVAFTHYVECEPNYDGGNVKISVNGGIWQLIPAASFLFNPYNQTLVTTAEGNTNPLAGEAAFTGGAAGSNNWGRSLIDLSGFVSGGENVRFRFDFGKDACFGITGWFVDDFDLYECPAPVSAPNILWDSDPLSPARATRSLTLSLAAASATGGAGTSAIQIKMVDLQHPAPSNRPQYPPPNFTAFDTTTNGECSGATTAPNYNGHHCDTSLDCVGPDNGVTADDGTCGSLQACTAAGEANSCARWVGPVARFREKQDVLSLGTYQAARLQCTPYYTDWTTVGVFTVFGAELLPSSYYDGVTFGSDCKGVESTCANVSPVVTMLTRRSGDTAPTWNPPGVTDQPDGADVVAVLNKFKGLVGSPSNATALLQPNSIDPNADVSGSDIVATVDAFKGLAYPFSGPCICPSTVACGALACPPGNCGAGVCVKTCQGGTNDGLPCGDNTHDHCPGGGTCPATGFCRDRCGRCSP